MLPTLFMDEYSQKYFWYQKWNGNVLKRFVRSLLKYAVLENNSSEGSFHSTYSFSFYNCNLENGDWTQYTEE